MSGEEGPRRPGALAGLLVGAALGVAVFLLANFVRDRFFPRGRPGTPPPGFARGGDARGGVRVLATARGPGLQAVLLPLREDGASTASEEAILDAALFPAGPAHRWARIVASNPRNAEPFRLSLSKGGLRLGTAAGAVGNEDLAGPFEARASSIPAHRALDLRVARVPDREVEIPPGGMVRSLVAFPGGTDLAGATGLELEGGPRLVPREVTTESLRTVLLDGRVGDLAGADGPASRPSEDDSR